jgi:hypothetical protein
MSASPNYRFAIDKYPISIDQIAIHKVSRVQHGAGAPLAQEGRRSVQKADVLLQKHFDYMSSKVINLQIFSAHLA